MATEPRREPAAGNYLMVLSVQFYRTRPGHFAVEGAFAEHLRQLLTALSSLVSRITVTGPEMSAELYAASGASLAEIDEQAERIVYHPLYETSASTLAFVAGYPRLLRALYEDVQNATVVHASTTHDLSRPTEFAALLLAFWCDKPTVCVSDIDLRNEARMNYTTGTWTLKSYLLARHLYDPIRKLQLHVAARKCSLVLLKGQQYARHFGAGRANVKDFLDSAFSKEHLIPREQLDAKLARLRDPEQALELVYFGRLTAYKGLDRCLQAIHEAEQLGVVNLRFSVFGAGADEQRLRELSEELGLGAKVFFHGSVPFGPQLFAKLYASELLLAAPLNEDTPRSALDAMACATPILAFDTYYYRDLARSGAVDLVEWPSVSRMAARIAHFAGHRHELIPMAESARRFAADNTQESWIERRTAWTLQLLAGVSA